MNIFSKWFGSKDKKEQKEEIAEEVYFIEDEPLVFDDPAPTEVHFNESESVQKVKDEKKSSEPNNLLEAIHFVVVNRGGDYLQSRGFINILSDYQVFKDFPAAKHIILNMQANGFIGKILQVSNWGIESKAIAAKYSTEFGAKEDIVLYLVQCIGYGLGYSNVIPKHYEKEEVSQSGNSDSTISIPQQPTNNTPSHKPPQPSQFGPYDPKSDLADYDYPTLDLLEDHSSDKDIISVKSILSTPDFQGTSMQLPCAIGKKENGDILMFDLANNPHFMISGSSGMGVSIFFNALITSLLYKKHPAEIKFVMVDPKKIEFSLYKPLENHFLAKLPDRESIVTDMSRVTETFISLEKEVEARQELLKNASVRTIKDYNEKFCDRKLNPNDGHRYMPYIVIFIDEYDDLTRSCGRFMESSLEKITQMGRATGISLIISILRPVGTVISSAIKANIMGRISFRVTSSNESRNILGQAGAEKLMRPGDMILYNGVDLIKGRCAYMELSEVNRINDFIKNQQGYSSGYELPDPNTEDPGQPSSIDINHLDPLFEDAARLVVFNQSGSTSLIQRKFAIGYNRAERMMDQLEKAGVVGTAMGSKPREVLVLDEVSLNNLLANLR